MKISAVDLKKPKIDKLSIHITGLFPDPTLNQFVEEFLNQNWELVYEEVFPYTRAVWQPSFMDIVSAFFDKVPFDQLFPL